MTDPAIKLFGRTIQLPDIPDSSGAQGDDSLPGDNNGEEDEEADKVISRFVL